MCVTRWVYKCGMVSYGCDTVCDGACVIRCVRMGGIRCVRMGVTRCMRMCDPVCGHACTPQQYITAAPMYIHDTVVYLHSRRTLLMTGTDSTLHSSQDMCTLVRACACVRVCMYVQPTVKHSTIRSNQLTRKHAYTYIRTHTHKYTHIRTHTHTNTHTHIRTHTHEYTHRR